MGLAGERQKRQLGAWGGDGLVYFGEAGPLSCLLSLGVN